MKFFWQDANGVKADVERHRAHEAELDAKIAELEGKEDPMSIASLRVYRRFRAQLLQSKADVVNKIGKKNV
jgi:phytoene/squalene synthetase